MDRSDEYEFVMDRSDEYGVDWASASPLEASRPTAAMVEVIIRFMGAVSFAGSG
jgi:hypothetical protein